MPAKKIVAKKKNPPKQSAAAKRVAVAQPQKPAIDSRKAGLPKKLETPALPKKIAPSSARWAFDEIADDWDSKRQNPSSAMPLFIETLRAFCKNNFFGLRVLDVGCGNARNAAFLVKTLKFPAVSCLDISRQMLLQAQKTAISQNISHSLQLNYGNVTAMPYPAGSFAAVFAMAMLHHLSTTTERERAFHEIFRVLRRPSIAFVTVWNSKQPRLEKYGGKKDALVGWKTPSGKTVERYYHFFDENELKKYAEHAGFKVHEIFFEKNGKKQKERSGAANICLTLLKN